MDHPAAAGLVGGGGQFAEGGLGRPGASLADSEEAVAPVSDDPQARLAAMEDVRAVRQAVLTLPEHYREAIVLCDLEQLSYEDAAEALGCPVGTVRSRLHRGREILGQRLRGRRAVESGAGDVAATSVVPGGSLDAAGLEEPGHSTSAGVEELR